jgi:hypothetical protein
MIKSISAQSYGNLMGGALQANNTNLVAQSLMSASSGQLQALNSNMFSTQTMTEALGAIGQNNPNQLASMIKNISVQSYGNLMGGALQANNSNLVAQSLMSASSGQLQALNSNMFSTKAMTTALSSIGQNNPNQLNSLVKNISVQSYGNLVGGAIQANDTGLVAQSLASGSPQQLQGISSGAFNTSSMFSAVSNLYNSSPSNFSQVMKNLSSNQVNSLLSSKGYYYNDGNFYSSSTKQEVNPSSIFPPTNTLDAGNNNTNGPITTFNPTQLQSKPVAPVDGAQSINPPQQELQTPTGIQMEKKL